MRLFKNDMVAIEKDGTLIICYVQKTDPANGAFLSWPDVVEGVLWPVCRLPCP